MVRTRRLHQLWERILLNQLFILYFSKKFIENILLIQKPLHLQGVLCYPTHDTIVRERGTIILQVYTFLDMFYGPGGIVVAVVIDVVRSSVDMSVRK
ncbi:hypothetical protein EGY05_11040 [Chryseobacterium arthrosphaerae]|nr:hypothetical protein EGY05_11040 [Chryseobacterium arthrosphaerae]